MNCEDCKWWDTGDYKQKVIEANPLLEINEDRGICHRYPQYEIRDKDYWCGEHKQKNTPIEYPVWSDMCWNVRTGNALRKLGISSVEELIKHHPRELLRLKNFGLTSLQEVERKLAEYNLSLSK